MRPFPSVRLLSMLVAISCGLVQASESIAADQGQYVRRSISRIGCVWLGSSASPGHREYLQAQIDQTLKLPRFDENVLPESFLGDFRQAVAAEGNLDERRLGEILERTLAPKILEVVKSLAVARAADLRSDLQKNSAVADKMKELDITGDQFLAIMNSAWIYVPVVKSLHVDRSRDLATAGVEVAVLWYHIQLDSTGENAGVRLERTVEASGSMAAAPSPAMDLAGGAETFAFRSAVKSCMAQLLRDTREIPEFSLSGQVIEARGSRLKIDIGNRNGVHSGEKYHLVENRQDKDGTTRAVEVGWFVARNPSDDFADGSVVSGSPYAGLMISEIPQMPLNLEFSALRGSDRLALSGTSHSATTTDLRLDFSNSWLSTGGDMLWGSASDGYGGTVDVSEFGAHLGVSLKPQLYRRVGLLAEAGLDYRWITLTPNQANYRSPTYGDTAVDADGAFFYGRLGVSVALAPSLDLFAQALAETPIGTVGVGDWKIQRHIGFGASLRWTLPALGFDPMDAIASVASEVVSQSQSRR